MKAIVPVAGIGSRLRPHTYFLPKVLLNVAGKPILMHILDSLVALNLNEIIIVTGHLGDEVEKFVRKTYDFPIRFVSQTEPLGLGHAIWCGSEHFAGEPLLIVLGDTIFDADLNSIVQKDASVLGVKEVSNPSRFGVVVTNSEGRITRLVEKPEKFVSNLAIVGIYFIRNSDLLAECLNELLQKDIKTKGEFQLTDALQMMIEKGEKFVTVPVEGWYDCGKPETLLETNRFLLSKKPYNKTISDCVVLPPVYIDDNAFVSRSVIGPYATIATGSVVIDSVVRNSIISDGARVESYLLENSIIGNSAVVRGSFFQMNVGNSSEINSV
ncbi:nucleotidyl transferase [Bacteroidetes/Chlorobi group bacterium MS-B_bin-24]|jgi:glucose-1-phosphate thymidylyltransferase|nr:MAG: nucleotidyl transferase [Bacteroidetes/Chlorobi group bacterium MS-B_bin-24]